MIDNSKALLFRLKILRQARGLFQENLAFKLGISQNAYSLIETGKTKLTVDRLIDVLDMLDSSIEDFLQCNLDEIISAKSDTSQK